MTERDVTISVENYLQAEGRIRRPPQCDYVFFGAWEDNKGTAQAAYNFQYGVIPVDPSETSEVSSYPYKSVLIHELIHVAQLGKLFQKATPEERQNMLANNLEVVRRDDLGNFYYEDMECEAYQGSLEIVNLLTKGIIREAALRQARTKNAPGLCFEGDEEEKIAANIFRMTDPEKLNTFTVTAYFALAKQDVTSLLKDEFRGKKGIHSSALLLPPNQLRTMLEGK